MKFVSKNQSGFTLLELLVVVGIIAIIGGAMIASFSGQETKAARGVATNAIAGVENAMRIYQATSGGNLPNNMESLVCTPYAADGVVSGAVLPVITVAGQIDGMMPVAGALVANTAYKFGGASNAAGIGGGMTLKLGDKFSVAKLTPNQAEALNDVGISSMRYAMAEACDATDSKAAVKSTVAKADGSFADVDFGDGAEGLVGIDIPNQAFSDPRPSGAAAWKFRGVGFSGTIVSGSPVLTWNAGGGGYNNLKLGAGAADVLVAMGLGQDSDLVGTGGNAAFGKAPFYGQVPKDKYAHYIALVNVGAVGKELKDGKAHVAAVVDARGDFLDEEIAEFQGQKI